MDLPNPGIEPRSPALQVDSLPVELQGKTKNTDVGSLSLLQQIFLTQESNRGLLHYRRILFQLSYQGSPDIWAQLTCKTDVEGFSPFLQKWKSSSDFFSLAETGANVGLS